MKKLMLIGALTIGVLVGCEEWEPPQGMDAQFHEDAKYIFNEIDEDTQEMEVSDRDDLKNFKLLSRKANSPIEQSVIENIQTMLDNQRGVAIEDNDQSFENYLDAREDFAENMEVTIYEFEFMED